MSSILKPRPFQDPQKVRKIIRMRRQGLTLAQIGAAFGMTRQAVFLLIKKAQKLGIIKGS